MVRTLSLIADPWTLFAKHSNTRRLQASKREGNVCTRLFLGWQRAACAFNPTGSPLKQAASHQRQQYQASQGYSGQYLPEYVMAALVA